MTRYGSLTRTQQLRAELYLPTYTTELRIQFSQKAKQMSHPTNGHLSTNYIQGQGREHGKSASQPHHVLRIVPATPLKLTELCSKIKPQPIKSTLMKLLLA